MIRIYITQKVPKEVEDNVKKVFTMQDIIFCTKTAAIVAGILTIATIMVSLVISLLFHFTFKVI
jgi:hypothetical protein